MVEKNNEDGLRREKSPVSVIIPCYNAEKTIGNLVESIVSDANWRDDDEVIVVDDCSTDGSLAESGGKGAIVVSLDRNSGPSVARNEGVRAAKNDILFFMDADTLLEPGSISAVKDHYAKENFSSCVNGRCSVIPIDPGIGEAYKGLVEYSWHEQIIQEGSPISCFNTRAGALTRQAFLDAGGFDSKYRKAEVEDYEFSYRLIKKHEILLDSRIQVRHQFPGILKTVKDYWNRTGKWVELFFERKRFDSGGTSAGNGLGHIIGGLFPFVFLLGIWETVFLAPSLLLLGIFFWLFRDFFALVYRKKGIPFLTVSVMLHLLYSVVILSSAGLSFLSLFFRRLTSPQSN